MIKGLFQCFHGLFYNFNCFEIHILAPWLLVIKPATFLMNWYLLNCPNHVNQPSFNRFIHSKVDIVVLKPKERK